MKIFYRFIFLLILILIHTESHADAFLVSYGKKYDLIERQLNKSCGDDTKGPEYVSILFLMRAASGLDERIDSGTEGRRPSTLFGFIRDYPSRFTSSTCDQLRKECIVECSKFKTVSSEECLIECNQYETWNK